MNYLHFLNNVWLLVLSDHRLLFVAGDFVFLSTSTPLRHKPIEIESDNNEYAIDFISDAKVDNWPYRRGPYPQFLTHFVGYDVLEWMLLEHVDMIVNNYLCFSLQMRGQIFPNYNPMFNLKLDTLLEISIYTNVF